MRKLFILVCLFVFSLPFHTFAESKGINVDDINRFVEEQREENGLAGVAYAIVSPDGILHHQAFGTADFKEDMTTETPVVIGSTSKAFTALATMQLVERNKIQLDESISAYLPIFSNTEKEAITVANLLHHTSGLPTMAGLVLVAQSKEKSLDETIELVKDIGLVHPIGKEFEYSNINYIILSAIVEKVSGMPYADYLKQRIIEPLKLTDTYVDRDGADNFSPGHAPWFGYSLPTKVPYYKNAIASGYMISSVDDMATFLMAHMQENEIITKDMVTQLHQGVAPISFMEKAKYGMGWFERELHGEMVIGHGGDIPSTGSSDMYFLPKQNLGVVVVSNTHNGQFAPGNVHTITEGIIAKIIGEAPEIEEGLSFNIYYLFFNLIVAIVLIGTLASFILMVKRKANRRNRVILWISILLQLILPMVFLMSVPLFLKAPWEAAFILQPDLITVLFIFFSLIAIRGVSLLLLTIKNQTTSKKSINV
ncbi:serine hydrolase domain-containing protein [Pseudoneobacillus sp. C159]